MQGLVKTLLLNLWSIWKFWNILKLDSSSSRNLHKLPWLGVLRPWPPNSMSFDWRQQRVSIYIKHNSRNTLEISSRGFKSSICRNVLASAYYYNIIVLLDKWSPSMGNIYDLLYSAGNVLVWMKLRKCSGRSMRHFQGFTQALRFPKRHNGGYILLGRDICYTTPYL